MVNFKRLYIRFKLSIEYICIAYDAHLQIFHQHKILIFKIKIVTINYLFQKIHTLRESGLTHMETGKRLYRRASFK